MWKAVFKKVYLFLNYRKKFGFRNFFVINPMLFFIRNQQQQHMQQQQQQQPIQQTIMSKDYIWSGELCWNDNSNIEGNFAMFYELDG
ncbi:MAG: hypothetical protein U5M23_11310 [Marinagarivorans sp.]|nr:hypothetical protein [Marinagarivorans sp.]